MKYASLIVTYNRKDKLIKALDSVLGQTNRPEVVILIDNCSTDGTPELLRKKGYLANPLVHYVRLKKNYGGSGGFYFGTKEALKLSDRFDFLSFSDDDAYFAKDYFSLMQQAVHQYPKVRVFCGTVMNRDGSIQTIHRRKMINWNICKERVIPVQQYSKDFTVDTFSFVGSFLNIDVIRKIGLPHKDYFIYFDDTEYSLRAGKYSKIINISQAKVIHDTAPSKSVAPITWKSYYDLRNSMLMKIEHSQWVGLRCYFLGHLVKASLIALLSPRFAGIRRRALYTYSTAYHDALNGKSGKNKHFLPGQPLPY